MNKISENQNFKVLSRATGPWAIVMGLFFLLKVTGAGNSISCVAQNAVMKAGMADIEPEILISREESFNYDFSVKDLNGKELRMADLKGKVIFLNLWATWCGPCRVEMPSIQNLYNSIDKDRIAFVILSLDQDGQKPKIVQYISSKEFTFPVYQPASSLPKLLRVNMIPATFIIGPDGKVKHKKVGMADYDTDEMRGLLRELSGV